MSDYPWSMLGLDRAATEREVRSAYARRLKIVRPDQDAVAFQALVEARDYALELARSAAARAVLQAANEDSPHFDEDDDDGDREDSTDDDGVKHVEAANAGSWVVTARGDEQRQPASGDAEIERDLPAPADGAPSVRPNPPIVATPVSIELSAPVTAAQPEPVTGEPPAIGGGATGAVIGQRPVLLAPEEVMQRLRMLLSQMVGMRPAGGPTPEPADRVLADLGHLPRTVRHMLEAEILQAMAAANRQQRGADRSWLNRVLTRLRLRADKSPQELAKARERRALFVALDEEFGWTTSDRLVYAHLPPEAARDVMAQLHTGLREAQMARDGVPRRWDADGLPVLEAADLRAFFGSELHHYGGLYQRAQGLQRWPPNIRWALVLMCPVWAVGLRQWRVVFAWLAAVSGGAVAYGAINDFVGAKALAAWPVSPGMIGFLPLAALHLYVAAFQDRLEIERCARAVVRADRRGLIDPIERARFLKRYAPAFRSQDERASGWGVGNWRPGVWFYAFLGYFILKLFVIFSGK